MSITHIIFDVMIKNNFSTAWIYVPILYLSCIFSGISSFLGAFYISYKNTRGAFSTSIIGGGVNLVINILFVKYIGLFAASISTLISFVVMCIARFKDIKQYVNISISIKNNCIRLIIAIIILPLYYKNNLILDLLIFIIASIYFITTNKKLISKIVLNLKYKRAV